MGNITLEHKFDIGDKVIVNNDHTLFADADPMGSPGVNFKGSRGIVKGIEFSHFVSYDDLNNKQVSRTNIRYNVNFVGNFLGIPEDSLSCYKD